MSGDTERLLRAAKIKLEELHRRVQDYTGGSGPDPVRIAVYQYQFSGGAEIVAALEAEIRTIQDEQQQKAAAR